MIYGVNFGRADIPAEVRRKFASRKRLSMINASVRPRQGSQIDPATVYARLVGVCSEPSEADVMLIQANNGHRAIWLIARGPWTAVYVY